jgi:predicted DNA repair protein MutK
MPGFLTLLGAVGTAAMIWVGGGIVVHGLEEYGMHGIGHAIEAVAGAASAALPSAAPAVKWMAATFLSALAGLLIGAVTIPLAEFALAPAWGRIKAFYPRARGKGLPI